MTEQNEFDAVAYLIMQSREVGEKITHWILLEERLQSQSLGGLRIIPGGGIEEGESSDSAVKREIAEELGLVNLKLEKLPTRIEIVGGTGRRLCPYIVLGYDGKIPNKVIDKGNYLMFERLDHQLKHKLESTRLMTQACLDYLSCKL